jgi:hypothetical protein
MVQNSVRRQGVDSSLVKYAALAIQGQDQSSPASPPSDSTVFTINLSPALGGIAAEARWISSASILQQQGLTFNQFSLPSGSPSIGVAAASSATGKVTASPYDSAAAPLLLIYRKIFNFTIYSLPPSYAFGGPIVGIIAFSPPNLTAIDPSLPELTITIARSTSSTSSSLITVHAPRYSSLPSTAPVPLCALFSFNGSVSFAPLAASPNVCEFDTFGDVALVVPWPQAPSSPSSAQPAAGTSNPSSSTTTSSSSSKTSSSDSDRRKSSSHWKLALGITCLAIAGLAFCVVAAIASITMAQRLRVAILARFASNEEALQTSLIGVSRAPTAAGVRTKPALEMDMAHFE